MLKFNKLLSMGLNTLNELNYDLANYNSSITRDEINNLFYIIEIQYNSYNIILNDIIEVGEYNE